MTVWQNNLLRKFEEKFPDYYEKCKNDKFFFLRSTNMCSVQSSELGLICTFTYTDEKHFSLEISSFRRRV